MKALSVKQPWANMIASGEKTIEVRTRATKYRGPLLIVSSLKPKIEPAGCALAIVDLIDCRPLTKADEKFACCEFRPGLFAWVLRDVRKIRMIPIRGWLGIYEVADF